MINRNYERLKLSRTYIGGSKKEELKTFKNTCNVKENPEDTEVDWLEFRRLVITNFEDILHVTCSRKFVTEKLSYRLLGISFGFVLLKLIVVFFIFLGLSITIYCLFQYFKHKENREIGNYNVVMVFTNNAIREELGLSMPNIE